MHGITDTCILKRQTNNKKHIACSNYRSPSPHHFCVICTQSTCDITQSTQGHWTGAAVTHGPVQLQGGDTQLFQSQQRGGRWGSCSTAENKGRPASHAQTNMTKLWWRCNNKQTSNYQATLSFFDWKLKLLTGHYKKKKPHNCPKKVLCVSLSATSADFFFLSLFFMCFTLVPHSTPDWGETQSPV